MYSVPLIQTNCFKKYQYITIVVVVVVVVVVGGGGGSSILSNASKVLYLDCSVHRYLHQKPFKRKI